jgi:hypothetical protein
VRAALLLPPPLVVSGRSNKATSLYPGYVVYVEARPTVAAFVDAVDAVIVPGFPHVFLVDCLYHNPTAT